MRVYFIAMGMALISACTGESGTMQLRAQLSTVEMEMEIDEEGVKPEVLYTANIRSIKMYCAGAINGMEQLGNLSTSSGTFVSGFNATAFLQPGENTLDVWSVPVGVYKQDYTYHAEDMCEVLLYGAFADGKKVELSGLNITVEEGRPTNTASKTYPDTHKTPLPEAYGTKRGNLTRFARPIVIKTIPRWRWVDATPIEEGNAEQMKQLYRAYETLQALMEKRDFEGLRMAWSLATREKAKAEAYFATPESFYEAVGFEEAFERYKDGKVEPRRDWSEYRLRSYMGGRLVRLEDSRSSSPLRIVSLEQDREFTVLPYFSMIDGRIVVSR